MRGSTAGLPENLQGKSTTHYLFLTILDTLFSSLIVAPCVVGYWRSVWSLMDIYIFPENPLLSAIISTGIGISGHLLFSVFQSVFERYFHPDRNRLLYYVVSRLYTVCFAFVCVNGWRGPWQILYMYTQPDYMIVIATTLVSVIALIVLRALRNISSTPFAVIHDSVKGYFEVLTMFRVSMEEKTCLYILDCLFSVLVIGTLVVFVWRGAWVLIDILLFPDDPIWSAWGSLVVGYTAVAIAFSIQPVMRWMCDRLTGAPRLVIADLFILFSLIGTVNVWRGIWNLLDIYFIPENQELSCWVTHWASLILLILLGCSNSLLVRGVYIDAEEPAGKCVVFPCYYLRLIFQQERLKKLNMKLQIQDNEKSKQNIEKITPYENNHVINVTTISNILEENHK